MDGAVHDVERGQFGKEVVAEKNHDEHEVVDQTLAVFLAHPRRVGRLQVAEEVLAQNGDVEDLPFVLGVREREQKGTMDSARLMRVWTFRK